MRARHCACLIKTYLQNDIEINPGPFTSQIVDNSNLNVYTVNCRGLGKLEKFRLILNKASALIQANPRTIILMQETMVKDANYLKLAWKGEFAITSGAGNSQGCITLTGTGVTIGNQTDLDNRGHYIEIDNLLSTKVAVLNIYAPNGYANGKREYFQRIFDLMENSNCSNKIIGGDFNLTFEDSDRHKRDTSVGELNIARDVKERCSDLGLVDTWQGYTGMTWKRGNTLSRLDRIYVRLNNYRQINIETDWTFCDSDHALVHAKFIGNANKIQGPKICRLDPRVVLETESLQILRDYILEQLETLNVNADPHLTFEFTKMTIRTKAIELSRKLYKLENDNLKTINDDIHLHQQLLLNAETVEEEEEIVAHLESQTNEKNKILETQGKNLAWKAKTTWYNEGEKSNKYFLNLLKRNARGGEMVKINDRGTLISEPRKINETVNNYYKLLYNQQTTLNDMDDNFFQEMFQVGEDEVRSLNSPITINELWAALKPLKDTAPGPDGISHIYLKKLWDIVGPIILNAWHHSIKENKMPPSHETSLLRLIPKPSKDTLLLKNWRPITLSNCDHKLITRVYNNRLLNVIQNHISTTQTAYIRNRNITDNIRLISTAIQLANHEPNINGSIVALDAQKAFDSVSHNYLERVLNKTGLNSFTPIFKLLYSNLSNDTIINGRIVGRHSVKNGVKQGDALSCTLFILAIEPLIRNIEKNENIKKLKSNTLDYRWPSIVGYADDVTCITINEPECKQMIFTEYERFSKNSGLVLNAEKTEIYNFKSEHQRLLHPQNMETTRVRYMGEQYEIATVSDIKINGLRLCQNLARQKNLNSDALMDKMERHFVSWAKRNLSLLGKIQIYKTYGLSQFLYHLTIFEPDQAA